MSIIHEALKKAASDNSPEISRSISRNYLFRASVKTPKVFRRIGIVVSVLILSVFSFSLWYPYSVSVNLGQWNVFSERPSLNSKIESEVFPTEQVLTRKKEMNTLESTGVLPNPQLEDGERALKEGIKFYQEGKVEEANGAFTRAIELLPLSPIAHNNLGMALRHQGKTDEALTHYQEAIRLDPGYAEAENNIGLIYDKAGSIDQAAIHYKKAIGINPSVSIFHLNYATLLERKGDFSNARKEYQLYLNLETDRKSEILPLVRSHLDSLKGF
jgi:tetratricopeptide (TPR) repeat protein